MIEQELRAFQRWIGRFRTASPAIKQNEVLAAMNGERPWLEFVYEDKPVKETKPQRKRPRVPAGTPIDWNAEVPTVKINLATGETND